MRLTPWEDERLLIFTAAELARRHRAAGLPLNAPEAIALICDAMLEAARAGSSYAEVEAAGYGAVEADQVMPGIADLVPDVRLEVLLDDGPRLILLLHPLAPERRAAGGTDPDRAGDGGDEPWMLADSARERCELTVENTSKRVVRVSSHYPFELVNRRLVFDRERATGFRLDIPAGSSERWGPGETRTIRLVRVEPSRGAGT